MLKHCSPDILARGHLSLLHRSWYRTRLLITYTYIYISICYYMSCSVSRPVSRPDLAISARVRRTSADIAKSGRDTRAWYRTRHVITYLSHTYNKKLFPKLINYFLKTFNINSKLSPYWHREFIINQWLTVESGEWRFWIKQGTTYINLLNFI